MASLNPRCTRCALHFGSDEVCVAGDGPRDAKIVVVDEKPGRGQPRALLKSELKRNGIENHTYITNLVKCRPPNGRAPTADEIRACKPYLEKELARINPDYVVTVGVPATKVLFRGKAKINQFHGELIENDKVDYIGMPTFHPAYTMRDPSKLPGFKNDIRRIAETLRGERSDKEFKWNIVRRGNLDTFLREFTAAPVFSFDLETSGLFPHGGLRYITAIGIALPTGAWVIPCDMHPDYSQYAVGPWRRGDALKKLIELLVDIQYETDKWACGWNAKFDNKWLRCMFGTSFYLDFDGMLASHTLDENTANDLTTNCRDFLDVDEYDIPLKWKQGITDDPMPNLKYCAQDCGYTLQLSLMFKEMLAAEPMLDRLFHRLVMRAARAMEDIEMEGLTLDQETMEDMGLTLLSEKIEIEQRLNDIVGYKVNWNAPKQIAKALYEDLGIKCLEYTKTKSPSTSETALLEHRGKYEVVDLLFEYRERAKFISTYINGFKKYMIGDKLYVTYKLHGTVTGRYSSRLHSIPRDGRIRNLVTAPPGWRFVQCDISQAELRIAAAASGDLELRRCFTEDIDVHLRTLMHTLQSAGMGEYVDKVRETARRLVGSKNLSSLADSAEVMLAAGPDRCIEVWSGWKEARKKAKAINFGFIYGMFENKFMETAKLKYGWYATYDEAHQAREAYFSLYSGLKEWHKKQKKLARLNEYVRNIFGRLRRLPGINARDKMVKAEAERQAVNAPIQGAIGDYKAAVMVEVHENIDHSQFRIVGEHHDAILGIVKIGAEDKVLPQILRIAQKPDLLEEFNIDLGLPMEGEAEVGPWGKGEKYVLQ